MLNKWKIRKLKKAIDVYYSNEKAMLRDIVLLRAIIKFNGLDLNKEISNVLNEKGFLKEEYFYDGKLEV